jgi:hypothetical protein
MCWPIEDPAVCPEWGIDFRSVTTVGASLPGTTIQPPGTPMKRD